jgi:hypothetical protein
MKLTFYIMMDENERCLVFGNKVLRSEKKLSYRRVNFIDWIKLEK